MIEQIKKICSDIEREWECVGLTDSIYEDFAIQASLRFVYNLLQKHQRDPKIFSEFMSSLKSREICTNCKTHTLYEKSNLRKACYLCGKVLTK
jgi:hypothetical protein